MKHSIPKGVALSLLLLVVHAIGVSSAGAMGKPQFPYTNKLDIQPPNYQMTIRRWWEDGWLAATIPVITTTHLNTATEAQFVMDVLEGGPACPTTSASGRDISGAMTLVSSPLGRRA